MHALDQAKRNAYSRVMFTKCKLFVLMLAAFTATAFAAPKPHIITLGKWTTVQWVPGLGEDKPITLKIRPLLIDARIREYILGAPHDVTDRLFVVRRVFRVNDNLPDDSGTPRWQWQ